MPENEVFGQAGGETSVTEEEEMLWFFMKYRENVLIGWRSSRM